HWPPRCLVASLVVTHESRETDRRMLTLAQREQALNRRRGEIAYAKGCNRRVTPKSLVGTLVESSQHDRPRDDEGGQDFVTDAPLVLAKTWRERRARNVVSDPRLP